MRQIYLFFFFFLFVSQIVIKGQVCPTLKDQYGGEGENVKLGCNNLNSTNCIDLIATFPTLSDSESYKVSSIPYVPYGNFTDGTVLDIYAVDQIRDEEFVKRINFGDSQFFGGKPFVFSFYGKTYNSFLISSNGFITFRDDLFEKDYSTGNFEGHRIPSDQLPKLSIFGVYQDVEFVNGVSSISINVVDGYPCRKVVINFNNARIVGTNQLTTSQIVLHEMTSIVEVFVKDKPMPDASARNKSALIGVISNTYTGIAAPSRNTGIWSTINEAWRFSPDGQDMLRRVSWFNNGVPLGGGSDNRLAVTVCPKKDIEQYSVQVSYVLKSGDIIKVEKEIFFKFSSDFPLSQNVIEPMCAGSTSTQYQVDLYSKILVPTSPGNAFGTRVVTDFNFKFYDTFDDAFSGTVAPISPTLSLLPNKLYYVRVESKLDPNCHTIATAKIENAEDALKVKEVEVCESMASNFQLSQLLCQLFDPGFQPTAITFRIDDPNGPFVTSANLTSSSKIYIIATTTTCGDISFGPITVKITTGPPLLTIPDPIVINLCDVVIPDYNPPKTETNFDWEKYFKKNSIIFTSDPTAIITVHRSEAEAQQNIGAMQYIDEGDPTKDYTYELWVRITPSTIDTSLCQTQCSTIVKINVKVEFDKIILNVDDADEDTIPDDPKIFDTEDANKYLCKSTVDRTIDLEADFQTIIKVTSPAGAVGLTKRFFASLPEAIDTLGVPILPQQILLSNENSKIFYVKYSLGPDPKSPCFVIKRLVYNVVNYPLLPTLSPIEVCTKNNQDVTITLADYSNIILGVMASQHPKPQIKYFSDATGATEITALTLDQVNPLKSVFVQVTSGYNTVCESELIEYKFFLQSINTLVDELKVEINCDDNADGRIFVNLKYYDAQLVTDLADPDIVVQYFRNYDPVTNTYANEVTGSALNFELNSSGQQIIYLRISKNKSRCSNVAKLIFNVSITNIPIKLKDNTVLLRCAVGQVLKFDLTEIIPKIYDPSNPSYNGFITNVYFYESEANANADKDRIPDPTNYALSGTDPRRILWVRFVSKDNCYSVKPFLIRIINPADIDFAKVEPPIQMCDDDLDDVYTFDLRAWVTAKVNNSTPGDSFLNDYDATLGAIFSFHLSLGGPALTSAEEQNFHPDPINQNFIYVKAFGGGTCEGIMKLDFSFGDTSILQFPIGNFCANEEIDLTQIKTDPRIVGAASLEFYPTEADLISGTNKITNETQFLIGDLSSIFVKIVFPTGQCPRKGKISFSPKAVPVFTMEKDLILYCQSSDMIDINIDPSNLAVLGLTPISYTIKGPNNLVKSGSYIGKTIYTTNVGGKYYVTITADNHCSYTADPVELKAFEVPEITKIIVESEKITVLAQAPNPNRTLEYTYDGLGSWQMSNVFFNVPKGVQQFYVRYSDNQNENGCVSEMKDALNLAVPNAITPNADGINDTWRIVDLDFYKGQKTEIKIFDRYNRLVFDKLSSDTVVWDGRFGGAPLPSATYWYIIKLPDGNELKGWLLVKH